MFRSIALMLSLLLVACATPSADDGSLYRALGEKAGISRIVDELVFRATNDARIAHHFAQTDLDRLREKLVEQLCVESGGPCTYTGDSMEAVHAGFDITAAEFDALVEDLQLAMDMQQVPQAAQNRLLARLAPMRDQVIKR